jgi:two-component system, chemotaxis family, protein-glutamate methylesterase/glutaminase
LPTRDTIVIGASAGGPLMLRGLLSQLPRDLPAAVLVVQHRASGSIAGLTSLTEVLQPSSTIPVTVAEEGVAVEPGQVWVAPPDHHLLITEDDQISVTRGPRENRARPSINVLFRSAAAWRGSRTIGVLMSGTMDDGVSGLAAIHRCGGVAIVQDPNDAPHSDLVERALEAVPTARVSLMSDMGELLVSLVGTPAPEVEIPLPLQIEARAAAWNPPSMDFFHQLGSRVDLVCPECHGPMVRTGAVPEAPILRCHAGHAYSTALFLQAQREEIEASLWAAVRALQERGSLLQQMSSESRAAGRHWAADSFGEQAEEVNEHADRARTFLLELGNLGEAP